MRNLKNKWVYILGTVLISAGLLRFWNIGVANFWLDEVVSIHMAIASSMAHKNISYEPPFYYFILDIWMKLFSNSETACRSLSALFDIGTIYLIYRCGKILLNRKTALLAAVFYSLSPLAIWYSREAKNYTFLAFLSLLSFFFFIKLVKDKRYRYWLFFGLSLFFSVYTNYFSFFLIPIYLIFLFAIPKFHKYQKVGLITLLLALFAFIITDIGHFWNSFKEVSYAFWIPKPTPGSLIITLENFNLGYTITDNFVYLISHIFFTLPFILGLIALMKKKETARFFLIGILFMPILIIYLVSQRIPLYIDRRLLIFLPFYCLILAYGIDSLKSLLLRLTFVIPAILLILISLSGLYRGELNKKIDHHMGDYIKKPFVNAVNYVDNNFREETDIIAHTNYGTPLPFHWYGLKAKGPLGNYLRDKNLSYFLYSSLNKPKSDYILNIIKKIPEITLDVSISNNLLRLRNKSIWLLQADWARSGNIDSDSQIVKDILSAHCSLVKEILIDGIQISYYRWEKD